MGTFKGRPALMFAAAPETEYEYIRVYLAAHPDAVIACADGGLRHARALGLTPDLVVGDFDSHDAADAVGEDVIRLTPEKDDTDTQHCLRTLLARGCAEVTVVCATGGRLDHLLANLSLCEQARSLGGRCLVLDRQNLAFLHEGGSRHFMTDPRYRFFSIVPLDAVLTGVTIRGAKYPLDRATVTRAGMISISNEPAGASFEIAIERGEALIVFSKDA